MWMLLGCRSDLLRLFTWIWRGHLRLFAKWCKNSLSKSVDDMILALARCNNTLIDKCSVKLGVTLGLIVAGTCFLSMRLTLIKGSHWHANHLMEVTGILHSLLRLSSRSIVRTAILATRRLDMALPGLLRSLQFRGIKSRRLIRN